MLFAYIALLFSPGSCGTLYVLAEATKLCFKHKANPLIMFS